MLFCRDHYPDGCTCGESPFTGHLLWCEALRGRPEFQEKVKLVGPEKYWRVVLNAEGFEYIIGVEIHPDDTESIIRANLKLLLISSAESLERLRSNGYLVKAEYIMRRIHEEYPERRYFIEVGNNDDYWVQIYYPPKEWVDARS